MNATASMSSKGNKRWRERFMTRWRPFWRRAKVPLIVLFFIILFLVAYLFHRIFINIYPGEAGVLWKRFDDGVEQRVYGGGLHIINPFNIMYKYEVRVQQRETIFTVLSKNGLLIRVRASVRFSPNRKTLYLLHEYVGPEYIDRVVIPETQAIIRRVLGEYEPDDIYATQGNIIQNIVLMALTELQQRHIVLDDLLIKEIHLPDTVASAIETKLEEEQKALAYTYILEREQLEIQRKQFESLGIQQFQKNVNEGLTPEYLRYQGIRATLELAKSNNAKLVVIGGSGTDGLPLILNTGGEASTAAATNAPVGISNLSSVFASSVKSVGAGVDQSDISTPLTTPAPKTRTSDPSAPTNAILSSTSSAKPSAKNLGEGIEQRQEAIGVAVD
ncbi:Membrane protease subunit stomatin/prohibitin-like protein [Hahella chejuensis KCTC 2396]|uniref:Membrane protease subunit stomatin/prohibitin-like protein n=2 Tax=Hahella chejuensis TaxID=158327 RepID=Q2SIE3_HAHCH|nr:Membrane protease subunit stomatin/prohibitin-like protein [Hahella chejuensis KCTC 2396]